MQGGAGCCVWGLQQLWMGRIWSRHETGKPVISPRPDLTAVFESKWSPGWWAGCVQAVTPAEASQGIHSLQASSGP